MLLLATASAAAAQERPVTIHEGFYAGNDYRELHEGQRRVYVSGVIEGMLLAPLYGAPKSRMSWLESCAVGMSDKQVTAIVDKFMDEHPARWHEQMKTLVYSAMIGACKRSP
jgi:hypothetical protein